MRLIEWSLSKDLIVFLAFIECDLTYAINKIGGRWKLQLLSSLENKKRRFSELKKEYSFITERMLTLQLRALEQDGLVKRTVYAEVPPRVEYELTHMALALGPLLKQLRGLGSKHRRVTQKELTKILQYP